MRFDYPLFPAHFEIPNDWISDAGATGFSPRRLAFKSNSNRLVSLDQIEPPFRRKHVPNSFRGLDRDRFVRLLRGFVEDDEIEAVPLLRIPQIDYSGSPFRYRPLDGMHRFYASIVACFTHLPAAIRDPCL